MEERLRLIFLSKDRTDIRQISLTWKKFYIFSALFVVTSIVVTGFAIGLFTRLYHNYRIMSLENDRRDLQKELLTIKEKVSTLSTQLAQIETMGDELRNVANLTPIDSDIRQVGVGGSSPPGYFDFGYYPDEIRKTSVEVNLDLDKLERAVRLERTSMTEIATKLQVQQNQINHFPSIRPILGGRITDRFGYRLDPFTGKICHHPGIDIPMPRGTKILATADGVVVLARTKHSPRETYGNEIIIDHGYGYKTLYAHLSKVLVRRGQKVKRWDPIGEVGATGRTTGNHLHYEVIYAGKRQDPENFIYN